TQITTPNPKFTESFMGRKIKIEFLSSWGDRHYVGMTGIQVLDENLNPIPISANQLSACPRDMNDIPGHSGDYRTLDKLVNNINITVDDRNMWLIPKKMGKSNAYLIIDLLEMRNIAGLRIYNY